MPRLRSKRTLGQRLRSTGTIDTVFVALAVEAAAPENLWFPNKLCLFEKLKTFGSGSEAS